MKGDFTRSTFQQENHYHAVRMQQGRVQLDADWNEQLDITAHRVETEARDTLGGCGGPWHKAGFAIQPKNGDLEIGKGRYYVHGILCENENPVLFTKQLDFPQEKLPKQKGAYLAYLDVWQRHLTALEAPQIREVALGGPDTATRTKTVWQVKLARLGSQGLAANCLTVQTPWDLPVAFGKLAARAEAAVPADHPCILVAGAGYRRLENQLYRVEVHEEGGLGQVTFKWSRDNGSIVAKWDKIDGNTLTVSHISRDKVLGFASGQWIELTDDTHELLGDPGTLVRLAKAEGNELTIDPATPTGSIDLRDFPRNPKVRRWDMKSDEGRIKPANPNDWIDLEDGVQVRFLGGAYRTGDYWLIPARTTAGDDQAHVEWPTDVNDKPEALLPHGIKHHYCRLALLEFDGTDWHPKSDCRRLFPPITELTSLLYVSGDGQEAMPGHALDGPLQVRVANGQHPVKDAKVRFTVAGGGTLSNVKSSTDPNGIAECLWMLGQKGSQVVTAELLDAANQPVPGQVIRFNADLSVASEVAYDPAKCGFMSRDPAAGTVQQAIDRLCPRITMVMAGGDGQEACVGSRLPQPLRVAVFWGNTPYTEGQVEFTVTHGSATVSGSPARINPEVIAACEIQAGSLRDGIGDASPIQVTAKLSNPPGGMPAPPPVIYTARFIDAACVYVGDKVCTQLGLSNDERTVSAIFTHFCKRVVKVQGVGRWDDQQKEYVRLLVDDSMTAAELARGLMITCDQPIDPATVDERAVGTVSMELPSQVLGVLKIDPRAGYDSVVIAGRFFVGALDARHENPSTISWVPSDFAKAMLSQPLPFAELKALRLLVRLKLGGSFIWARGRGPRQCLDGGLFGDSLQNGAIVPVSRKDDNQPGRNLEMRFYIAAEQKGHGSIGLIPVLGGDFFKPLDVYHQDLLGDAISLAIDRKDPTLKEKVPKDFVLDTSVDLDLERAKALYNTVYPRGARRSRSLRVVVAGQTRSGTTGSFQQMLEQIRKSLMEHIGIELKEVPVSGDLQKQILEFASQGSVDAVFGPVNTLRGLRSDEKLGPYFGPLLVIF